jgi:hypothetical protein
MDKTKKRILVTLVIFVVAVPGGLVLNELYRAWSTGHDVLSTMWCMNSLMSALAVEMPVVVDTEGLSKAGDKHGFERCHEDAWGNPFQAEHAPGADPPYLIRSLGQDGKRGPCCQRTVENWKEDAILRGNEWLQVWRTLGKPRE